MDKKFYVYHLKNSGLTKLIKIKYDCTIEIFSNSSDFNNLMILKPNGYNLIGSLSNQIKVYYDNTNKIYYLCSDGHSENAYLNIGVNIANDGYAINDYEDNFDTSNLTEVLPLDINNAVTNRKLQYNPTVTANTVVEYIAKTTYRQYMTQCSLILLSVRNNNDVGGSGLYLLHRKCANTIADTPVFTIETIYADNVMSQFDITPTKTGFTFTNGYNFRYSITEISNNTDVNSL